jgi:glycosyltransferase involved in cell wall biosynthesis
MTKITVSMPAYNSGEYIRESMQSVLAQDGVDIELIVVDDDSTDDTANIVQSFTDPRIRYVRNKRKMGIGYCHNVVIYQSSSPFIAHVDSDDWILPGALQEMVQLLESDSNLGQAHCHFLLIDEKGKVKPESSPANRMKLLQERTLNRNYRKDLIAYGNVINCLRTYRREVFTDVGYFDEDMKRGADYEMALRLVEKFEIGLVPDFLYCHRTHATNTSIVYFAGLRNWVMRAQLCHQLIKNKQITYITREECDRLLMSSLCRHVLKLDLMLFFFKRFSQKVRLVSKEQDTFPL